MTYFGIDIGTTNSGVALWNEKGDCPEMIHLEGVCRNFHEHQEIDLRYSIPSCVFINTNPSWKDRVGKLPFFQKRYFIGKQGLIGQEALQKDASLFRPQFIPAFKPYLARDAFRTLTKIKNKPYPVSRIATIFIRELFAHTRHYTGERPRYIAFSVPVDSYEPYRAQLKSIAENLGVKKFQFIDEPVAAAIGYGICIDEPQAILVIDFGGGTLDMALIEIKEQGSKMGRCQVIAKGGIPVGGNLVDSWIVEIFCKNQAYNLKSISTDPNILWWYRVMCEEACRVKESLYFRTRDTFFLSPPKEMQSFDARLYAKNKNLDKPMDFSRAELITLLEEKGLYSAFTSLLDQVINDAMDRGYREDELREVLMVGGSTLLPNIYPIIEQRFGRDRVRAWQPFNAVAYGACAYAANRFHKSDFITHDYAFITYDKENNKPEYNIIVPHRTPFPTAQDFWKRQLTPTCPLGEPERIFKLVICEIGRRHSHGQEFIWDSLGQLHTLNPEEDENRQLITPLNDKNPVLGYLNPPHQPSDKTARLEISFMVNEDRWLCTTVFDLKTKKYLLIKTPVIRLR
jgi:molecular chaperone DnaK (HSP70)